MRENEARERNTFINTLRRDMTNMEVVSYSNANRRLELLAQLPART